MEKSLDKNVINALFIVAKHWKQPHIPKQKNYLKFFGVYV